MEGRWKACEALQGISEGFATQITELELSACAAQVVQVQSFSFGLFLLNVAQISFDNRNTCTPGSRYGVLVLLTCSPKKCGKVSTLRHKVKLQKDALHYKELKYVNFRLRGLEYAEIQPFQGDSRIQ